MGHQATLFITPKDTRNIEAVLRDSHEMAILHSYSPTASPRRVDRLDFEENGSPWLFLLLALPEHVEDVQTRHVPAQGHWAIDVLSSPVVEFTRSFFDGTVLRAGRIYYVDGYFDSTGAWVEKSPAFRTWAETTLRRVKRTLKRRGNAYVGSDASAWLDAGGKLDPPWQR